MITSDVESAEKKNFLAKTETMEPTAVQLLALQCQLTQQYEQELTALKRKVRMEKIMVLIWAFINAGAVVQILYSRFIS